MRLPTADPLESERTPVAGGRSIFIAQGLRLLVRLGSAVVLARLLSPHDYGLFGMAAAVFGLLYMARDLGVVTALQQPGVTPRQFNALCRIGAAGGIALAALGAMLAVPTGWFFGDTESVPPVVVALCTAFIFTGAAAPAIGTLYREQRGGQAALLEAAGMATGALAAVIAAEYGAGVWALVLMNVVQEIAICVIAWAACPTRPGRDVAGVDWRALVAFGANLTGQNVVTYCTRTLDQVTVGRAAGTAALGFYGRGAQVAALPVQFGISPFNSWIVASLARKQGDAQAHVAFFRAALNGLLHVSLLGAAVCVAVPDRLLLVLFGESWLPAVPIVRWLGIALAVQPWLAAPVWLLSARGDVRRLLHWSLTGLSLMAAACVMAYGFGADRIALATALAATLQALLSPLFCASRTAVTTRDWLAASITPLLVHGGFAAVLFAADQRLAVASGGGGRFAVPAGLALGYYGLMLLVCPPFRREMRHHLFWSR